MTSVVIASLNAKLQPLHRGDLEDAFDDLMQRKGFGMRVVGGGTLQEQTGEIALSGGVLTSQLAPLLRAQVD